MWTNLSQGEWSYCDANISSPLVSLVSIFFLRSNIPQVLYQRLLTVEAYSNNNWHSIGAIFTHALAYTRSRQTIGGSMIGQAWSLCYWVPDPRVFTEVYAYGLHYYFSIVTEYLWRRQSFEWIGRDSSSLPVSWVSELRPARFLSLWKYATVGMRIVKTCILRGPLIIGVTRHNSDPILTWHACMVKELLYSRKLQQ